MNFIKNINKIDKIVKREKIKILKIVEIWVIIGEIWEKKRMIDKYRIIEDEIERIGGDMKRKNLKEKGIRE